MDTGSQRILVVDDDPALRDLLTRYLGEQGFEVDAVADAAQMDERIAAAMPDLLVLDLMLPGEDGLSIAKRLQAGGTGIPILMLSARGDDVDRIVGLEVGADDYLSKPFNPRELLARIRAVLRRRHPPAAEDGEESEGQVHRFGDFRLDDASQELWNGERKVALTSGEFALLKVFVEHPGRVLSRDALMDMLKGYDRSPFDRSIDVRVTRLRRKIEPDPGEPVYIRTVWGEGYRFTPGGPAGES